MSRPASKPLTAESGPHRVAVRAILVGMLYACVAPGALALSSDRDLPADIEAGRFVEDPRAGTRVFSEGVTMRQGSLNVASDTATVFVDPQGNLQRVVLEGSPVVWREQLDSGETLTARAGRIDYDFATEEVVLERDVMIDRGPHQITGPSIRYDLQTSKLDSGEAGGRIKVRITPDAASSQQ